MDLLDQIFLPLESFLNSAFGPNLWIIAAILVFCVFALVSFYFLQMKKGKYDWLDISNNFKSTTFPLTAGLFLTVLVIILLILTLANLVPITLLATISILAIIAWLIEFFIAEYFKT